MKEKIKKLEELKQRIIKETKEEEVWFYSEEYGEFRNPALKYKMERKGWFGAQDIFFIGLNPSTNPSKDPPNLNFFFKELEKNGFKNAHLTDLIKIRASNNERDNVIKKNLGKQKEYLDEEIKILKPKLLIAMGRECEKRMNELGYENHYLIHPAARFHRKRFKKEMKKLGLGF